MANVYHGHLKNREALEQILGDNLPKRAKVWFAWRVNQPVGPKETRQNVLAYWSLDKRFYGVDCYRTIFDKTMMKWDIRAWMYNSGSKDERKSIIWELRMMEQTRMEGRNPNQVTFIESALQAMMLQETAWKEGKDEIEYDPDIPAVKLPSDVLPPMTSN